jgi:Tfp pilus assembly protein PilX
MYMTDGENGQRGIALFMSLIVLLLLSVLAIALVYMATTDTTVNANYRNQQVLYFAAKAGIEEARDRLMSANPNTVLAPTCTPSASCLPAVPAPPTIGNGQILYILGARIPPR